MNVAVLGAGAWGTALAKVLHENGHSVTIWTRDAEVLAAIQRSRRNERYLPDVELPETWTLEPDLREAVRRKDCVVCAIASQGFRDIASQLADAQTILVSVTKGIEYDTGKT